MSEADPKSQRRTEKLDKQTARLYAGSGRFAIILADPPWRFEPYSRETGLGRAADRHYDTLPTSDIARMRVNTIADKDSILFLWATVPMLLDGIAVLDAWGFKYVSSFVWVKDKFGTGFWNRNQHEILLVGKRGKMPAPERSNLVSSVILAPVAKHSTKPEQVYRLIEVAYKTPMKIELFARTARIGWWRWGDEAPKGEGHIDLCLTGDVN